MQELRPWSEPRARACTIRTSDPVPMSGAKQRTILFFFVKCVTLVQNVLENKEIKKENIRGLLRSDFITDGFFLHPDNQVPGLIFGTEVLENHF